MKVKATIPAETGYEAIVAAFEAAGHLSDIELGKVWGRSRNVWATFQGDAPAAVAALGGRIRSIKEDA